MAQLRLALLGGFGLADGQGTPIPISMRKAKALLAWLALHADRPQPRERLATLLWGDSTDAKARRSLRQALSVLRAALPETEALLSAETDCVVLAREGLSIDVIAFEAAAAGTGEQELARAAALYRGELLEGFHARAPEFEDWLLAERSRLRERATLALTRLLAIQFQAGTSEAALRTALRLLAIDPLRESTHRDLMSLYLRLGRRHEALRQYHSCQALLHQELGIAPEPATQALYRQALVAGRVGTAASEPLAEAAPQPLATVPTPPEPAAGHRTAMPPATGRETELGQIRALLETCRDGESGAVLLVRGEAGIGKSFLCEAAQGLARRIGMRTLRIALFEQGTDAATPAMTALAIGLLRLSGKSAAALIADPAHKAGEALFLREALGTGVSPAEAAIHTAMDGESRRAGQRRALALLLHAACASSPVMIEIEDIHWADGELLDQLAGLAAAAIGVPALLLLTARTEGEPLDPAWRGAMGAVRLVTLDLAPLRSEAALAIAARRVGETSEWVRRCVERAAGNPLFLQHLLSEGPGLGNAVPHTIRELVETRLARLSGDERRAAQAAAALGERFSAHALAALGADDPACEQLCSAGLLRRDGEHFRFTHALIRDAIEDATPSPAWQALHRRAAQWYRGRDPVLHASHLERAAEPAAVDAWIAAAAHSEAAHRYEPACEHAERAWQLAYEPEERARAGLLLARLERELGRPAAAARVLDALAGERLDATGRCDLGLERAALCLLQDDYRSSLAALDTVAEDCSALRDPARLARLHYQRGNALFSLGDTDGCLAAHSTALELAGQADIPELEARALSGLGDAYYQRGRLVTAHDHFDRCIQLAEQQGLIRVQTANLAMRGLLRLYLNRLREGLDDCQAALRLAELTHDLRDACITHDALSLLGYFAGDLAAALGHAEAGLAIAREIGARRFEADHLCTCGTVHCLTGEAARGRAELEAAAALVGTADMAYAGAWVLGFLARFADDPEVREQAIRDGEAALATGSVSHNHLQFRQNMLELAVETGDWDALEHHARALEAYTAAEPLPWASLFIRAARLRAAWAQGERSDTVRAQLRALQDEARAIGYRLALPEA